MQRIGILGGISAASTLHYYDTLHRLYYQAHGDYYYPEILVNSLNFQHFTDLENSADPEPYRQYILQGLARLARAGADFAVMAANSPHSVLEDIRPQLPLPVVSILDAVGRRARELGMKRLLLTGIAYTMRGTFYPRGLAPYGIQVVVPTPEEQQRIDHIIFSQLAIHQVDAASKAFFLELLASYPVDGVILGCTELPQLVTQADTAVPLLNSLELHCQAALQYAALPS